MQDKTHVVLVFSRAYATGLSIVRSLGEAGYTVDLITSAYKKGQSAIITSSKYIRHAKEVISKEIKNINNPELLDALLEYASQSRQKVVLFPTDDFTTAVMDSHRSILEPHFLMPGLNTPENGMLLKYMDKSFQAKIAQKSKLYTPSEWCISLEREPVVPSDMVFPCFCKPLESVSGYKDEITICNNAEQLKKHLLKLRNKNPNRSILVQEFLNIDQEIDISGLCVDQEIIMPALIKKTRIAKYEKGVTLAGKVISFEEIKEINAIKKNIVHMLKQFHYTGMFDMELNIVGNKVYFNEINFRCGGPNYSYLKSGVNLPVLFVKAITGQNYTEKETQLNVYGKSFIYEKVAWEDYSRGYLSKKALKKYISNADITLLYNESDPSPGNIFRKQIYKNLLKGRLRMFERYIYSFFNHSPSSKNTDKSFSATPRIIISGRNYSSILCMARSLGQAGYHVEVLRIFESAPKRINLLSHLKPDAYSKYVHKYHVCISYKKNERIVEKLKELAEPFNKTLLIPVDDLVAAVIDQNYDSLSTSYLLPNINKKSGEINRLMSKDYQKKLAQESGLSVINSHLIKSIHGHFDIPDDIKYPCFIKPNISKNSTKNIIQKCNSKDELRKILTEFSKKQDIEILIEDYIEISKEYALLGLSTSDTVIAPGFFEIIESGKNNSKGVTLIGKTLACSEKQDYIQKLIDFVKSLHYEGLFDIDFIETSDGKIYFLEMNFRFGASGYAITECGVNLPGIYADYKFRHKLINTQITVDKINLLFISEKILLEEYAKNIYTLTDVKNKIKQADIFFIKNEKDTQPYRHFRKFYLLATLARIYFKITPHY